MAVDQEKVRLSELIGPAFYEVHRAIRNNTYTHYWLNGGRGSLKSSFAGIEVIHGVMTYPGANAVCFRKVGETLAESVYEQLLWAIQMLGVERFWYCTTNPMRMIYKPTGQRILFRGLDKAKKSKSIKVSKGYFRYVWFEELDEFAGMEEIRTVLQSLLRSGDQFCVLYTYNPPKSQSNWVNAEALIQRDDRLVHSSTYLEAPAEWLGTQFILEAEHLKATHPEAYRNEYLGEITGTGAEVFTNLTNRRLSDDEIKCFDHVARGLDWGYASDPLHYTVNHYDAARRRLYIFGEIHQAGLTNRMAAERIRAENTANAAIVADSAEPKSIAEFNNEYRIRVVPSFKGPDSVRYGIKWLQDLDEIVIDAERCPNTWREFYHYELDRDANGNLKAAFPDRNNHSIDAVRYSRQDDIRRVRVT